MELLATTERPLERFARDEGLIITEIGDYGTYPFTDSSIIQFEDDICCYVVSYIDKLVERPEDGKTVRCDYYGTPVSWCSYVRQKGRELIPDTRRTYTALKHETTYSVGRKLQRFGISERDFVEHNDIMYGDLIEGRVYHLPIELPDDTPKINYEVYDEPETMFIARQGGAQKWCFGNIKTVDDIISGSGIYPQFKQVQVAALATIPVDNETFAYYMDELALGDYKTSGKVRYQIGYAHADLARGEPPELASEPPEPVKEKIKETLQVIESKIEEIKPKPRPADDVPSNPYEWKASIEWFDEPKRYTIDIPRSVPEIIIHDLDQRHPNKRMKNGGNYLISARFWKDGVEYGLPLQCAFHTEPELRRWYGIPMSSMYSQDDVIDELYESDLTLPEKMSLHHHLSTAERTIIPMFALTKLSYDRLKLYGKHLLERNKK